MGWGCKVIHEPEPNLSIGTGNKSLLVHKSVDEIVDVVVLSYEPYATGKNLLVPVVLVCGMLIKSQGLWLTKERFNLKPSVDISVNLKVPIWVGVSLLIWEKTLTSWLIYLWVPPKNSCDTGEPSYS